jgi:hypothetical protein
LVKTVSWSLASIRVDPLGAMNLSARVIRVVELLENIFRSPLFEAGVFKLMAVLSSTC